MITDRDEKYMRQALELAAKGLGFTSPNPLVGAVIVKADTEGRERVIGQGYHERYGQLHAERNALADCAARGEDPAGATVYVTLEPCCHTGKTPPCTDALIEAGVARVVMGSADPNPLVAGKGAEQLRAAGIEVEGYACEAEALAMNEPFFHFIATHKPLVVLKYAMTLDGKIATRNGESRWITSESARRNVHLDRQRYAAIMVGMGTIAADDPILTCRLDEFYHAEGPDGEARFERDFPQGTRNPLRIICDSRLSIDPARKVVRTAAEVPTLIVTCSDDREKAAVLEKAGCEVLVMPAASGPWVDGPGRIDLRALVNELGSRGIDSLFIEGGATLAWSALDARIVHKVQAYIAPKVFGGVTAPGPVGGRGVLHPSDCIRLVDPSFRSLGPDMLVEGGVEYCSPE